MIDGNDINDSLFDKIDIPQLSEEQKQSLDTPLTKQEMFDVIKSMNLNKTPGFDGIPVEFYMEFFRDVQFLHTL